MTAEAPLIVGNAPLSWGVFEGDDSENPEWHLVLDELASAGYSHLELGPVGFLPESAPVLRDELAGRGLKLTAGFVYEDFHDLGKRDYVVEQARRVARILAAQNARYLVLIDRMNPVRQRTAGRDEQAVRLDDNAWRNLMETVRIVAELATADFGLRPVLHPHCGTFIEFADEIEKAMSDLPDALLGLCLDTGHSVVAGLAPDMLVKRYASRAEYFHLKDVDEEALTAMRGSAMTFDEALGRGLFCSVGNGLVDFEAFRLALQEVGFHGLATVEQDPNPFGQKRSGLADARASIDFLCGRGLAEDASDNSNRWGKM